MKRPTTDLEKEQSLQIFYAKQVIHQYGSIDGAHHKQWVLDQVIRILCGSDDEYEKWVFQHNYGEDGPDSYRWDEGIAP